MTDALAAFLRQLASEVAGVIVLRSLPFVIWAVVARRVRLPEKGLAVLLYGSLAVLANSLSGQFVRVLITAFAGALYFSLASLALIMLVRHGGLLRLRRQLIFLFCCVTFFLIPSQLFQVPGGIAVVLAGWELTFSTYSYAVETNAPGRTGTMGEGMFFLLVNPVLCFTERGRWTEPGELGARAGVLRCATGALLVTLATGLLRLNPQWQATAQRAALTPVGAYGDFVGTHVTGILRVYFSHAGIAHLQLGLLSLMGYQAPERYVRPLLARSPAEFWRRWNVYIGSWFRRYVFSPLSLSLARRRVSPTVRTIVAVLVTFAATGLAHDVFLFLRTHRIGPGTTAFVLQALLLLGFETASRRFPLRTVGSAWFQRVCFWHGLILLAWILTVPS